MFATTQCDYRNSHSLSPLGFRPRYCCLPHRPNEVLGLGLLARNLNPTLTSPYTGSQNNLQSIVQRRTDAIRGLTKCKAKQPMQETQWCYCKATSCNELGTLALNHTILRFGTNDHTQKVVTVGRTHSPKAGLVVTHVATLQSIGHMFIDAHAGRRIAGHNATAPHWSPSFILDAMLSELTSHQRLERPNAVITPPSDSRTRCYPDLLATRSLRCDQCAMHAIARSNTHTGSKKCESLFAHYTHKERRQHKLHAHSSAIGSTLSVA